MNDVLPKEFLMITEYLAINKNINDTYEDNLFAYFFTVFIPIIGSQDMYAIHFGDTANYIKPYKKFYKSLSGEFMEYDEEERINELKKFKHLKKEEIQKLLNSESLQYENLDLENNHTIGRICIVNIESSKCLYEMIAHEINKLNSQREIFKELSIFFSDDELEKYIKGLKKEFITFNNTIESVLKNKTYNGFELEDHEKLLESQDKLKLLHHKIDLENKINKNEVSNIITNKVKI